MKNIRNIQYCLLILFYGLPINTVKGQSSLLPESYIITTGVGLGKVQYYFNNHPAIILNSTEKFKNYSPSWLISFNGLWKLSNNTNLIIGLQHVTITESDQQANLPPWRDFDENRLVQGFIHLVEGISIHSSNDNFSMELSTFIGSPNFIGTIAARETSNALFNGDFGYKVGFTFLKTKGLYFSGHFIQSLTKFSINSSPSIYYRYHSFNLNANYTLQ